jgi:hypothetical protein
MTTSIKPARIKFLSTYRGEANFQVLTGPMANTRVRVRYMPRNFYENDWDGGRIWNYTREEYMRLVIGSIGIVNSIGGRVTPDVLAALDAEFDATDGCMTNDTGAPLCTGEVVEGVGWVRELETELV